MRTACVKIITVLEISLNSERCYFKLSSHTCNLIEGPLFLATRRASKTERHTLVFKVAMADVQLCLGFGFRGPKLILQDAGRDVNHMITRYGSKQLRILGARHLTDVLRRFWRRDRKLVTLQFIVEMMSACGYFIRSQYTRLHCYYEDDENDVHDLMVRLCSSTSMIESYPDGLPCAYCFLSFRPSFLKTNTEILFSNNQHKYSRKCEYAATVCLPSGARIYIQYLVQDQRSMAQDYYSDADEDWLFLSFFLTYRNLPERLDEREK
jgi:hypothetical protein